MPDNDLDLLQETRPGDPPPRGFQPSTTTPDATAPTKPAPDQGGGLSPQAEDLLNRQYDINRQREARAKREQARMSPLLEGLQTSIQSGQQRTDLAFDRLQTRMQRPPPLPPQFKNELGQVGMLVATIAAGLFGARSGASGAGIINSMAGMINGYNNGQQQRAKQELERFTEQLKALREQNDEEITRYKAAQEKARGDVDMFLNLIKAEALQQHNTQLYVQAQQEGLDAVSKFLTQQTQAQEKLKLMEQRIEMFNQRIQAQEETRQRGLMNADTLRAFAEQYVKTGDPTIKQNVGRGNQGSENLAKINNMIEQVMKEEGVTPEEMGNRRAGWSERTSSARTLGTYGTRVDMAMFEAKGFAQQALQVSDQLPRGRWVPVNRAVQAMQAGTSDERLYQFGFVNMSLANAYARAVNPTGVPRLETINHALQFLSTATSPQAYRAVVGQLLQEIERAGQAVDATRAQRQGGRPQAGTTSPSIAPTGQGKPQATTGGGNGWSIREVSPTQTTAPPQVNPNDLLGTEQSP